MGLIFFVLFWGEIQVALDLTEDERNQLEKMVDNDARF